MICVVWGVVYEHVLESEPERDPGCGLEPAVGV